MNRVIDSVIYFEKLNFTALRNEYSVSKYYCPTIHVNDTFRSIRDSMLYYFENGNNKRAFIKARNLINFTFFNIEAHKYAAVSALRNADWGKGDSTFYRFHDAIAEKLFHSIMDSADGSNKIRAYKVINQLEEYAVLDRLGLSNWQQGLIVEDSSAYDIFSGVDQKGDSVEVYFDVTKWIYPGVKK